MGWYDSITPAFVAEAMDQRSRVWLMSTKNDGVEGSHREKGLLSPPDCCQDWHEVIEVISYPPIAFLYLIVCTVQPKRETFEKWAAHHHHQLHHPDLQTQPISPRAMLSRLAQQRAGAPAASAVAALLRRRIATSPAPATKSVLTELQKSQNREYPPRQQRRFLTPPPKPGAVLLERRPDRELPGTSP